MAIVAKIVRRINWLRYKQSLKFKIAQWKKRGGIFSRDALAPYTLIRRPIPLPVPLDDPIFSDPHFATRTKHYSAADGSARKAYEALYRIAEPCIIEPEHGYVIIKPSKVVIPSLPFADWALTQGPQYFSELPSYSRLMKASRGAVPVRQEKSVVVMRHTYDSNYSHLHSNMLPIFKLLEECGIPKETPVLVSPELAKTHYFQQMQKRGGLAHRQWIVHDSYVETNEAYFCYVDEQTRENVFFLAKLLDAPPPTENATRRIFLVRKNRSISNLQELEPILRKFKFDMVDTADLSFPEQMSLFADTRVVCAGHGSGFTNIFYRQGHPMTVLELFPKNENDSTFCGFARLCGYDYHYFIGDEYEGGSRWSSYRVPPKPFEQFLSKVLPD